MGNERRHVQLLVIAFSVLIVTYAIHWLYENPRVSRGEVEEKALGEKVLAINASALPTRAGDWELISAFKTSCVNETVRACIGLDFLGKRNVGGTEVWIAARAVAEAEPKNSSVRVVKAEIRVETFNNTIFGDMVPEDFVGAAVFKPLDGPFTVEARPCGDPNRFGCMVAFPEKPAWGKRLLFEAWPDFTVEGKPPAYSGRILVVFTVEYEVRTGYFTAEKREIKVELPVKFEIRYTGAI